MIFEKQIVNTFRSSFLRRCDDTGTAFYFSAADFPGLEAEPFAFPSSKGHSLKGYFYHYPDPIPGRIVVFDHGFGGGHRSYMKEIELLCRHGYLVFSYDHTGCMESGGENIGDFSTANICALHPEVSHIVVLSGFIAVEILVNQFFGGIMKGYRKAILALDPTPEYFKYNAVESLSGTDAKVLLVYSDNDRMVSRAVHFDALKEGLSHKDKVRLLLVSGKGHNPNYTEDAVAYLGRYSADVAKKAKTLTTADARKAYVDSWDWHRMTAQDESVWAEIFKTLDA